MPRNNIQHSINHIDWTLIERELNERGYATTDPFLTAGQCDALIGMFADDSRFRSRIEMSRYKFGEGEYKYFAEPLPETVGCIREFIYPRLATIANRWNQRLGNPEIFPATLQKFLEFCHSRGQAKPTPLLLRYKSGGYNCLHQDLYGEISFPLQMTCVLSRRDEDYTGGQFLLVEQRPRAQSRGDAIDLDRGQAIIFPNRLRPVHGTRGEYRVNVRHGVSRVLSGSRFSLGIIFHDAK
jgi:uncharacterized protein